MEFEFFGKHGRAVFELPEKHLGLFLLHRCRNRFVCLKPDLNHPPLYCTEPCGAAALKVEYRGPPGVP